MNLKTAGVADLRQVCRFGKTEAVALEAWAALESHSKVSVDDFLYVVVKAIPEAVVEKAVKALCAHKDVSTHNLHVALSSLATESLTLLIVDTMSTHSEVAVKDLPWDYLAILPSV